MCGICGIFGHSDSETLRKMLSVIPHRGPDDEYWVNRENFSLGARRLSIVDVEGGRQPLTNENGTVWAAQNGELYNFPILHSELQNKGHHFITRSDTELLPHLFEEYGTRLPEKIDGMFAVAVWDDENKTGLLARDRMGKKPLYYLERDGSLFFASEIKCLLQIPGFQRKINLEALHHFLSYKHVPAPFSIFEGISILKPAHALVYQPGNDLKIWRYWDVDFSPDPEISSLPEEELIDRLLDLLRKGIERRLMSDVPIGFFLSGGIDSSLSSVLAAELSSTRIKTFTLTYADDSSNEGKELDRYWAHQIADKYDTDHHEEAITFANFPQSIRSILKHFDEPFAGVVSTYYLSQLISKHVKVALSGDGADELFGSYRSHRLAFPLANFPDYQRTGNNDLIRPFQDQVDYLSSMAEKDDWAWRYKLLVYSDEEKDDLYSSEFSGRMRRYRTLDHLHDSFRKLTSTDPLNRILEAEFRTIFPDQVLTFVDRLSMAHSLEVRSAFLDTELVEFVARLSGSWKIRNGETKYLLKKAALRYFPREMVYRPKEGFLMPVTQWILRDLQDYVRQTLSPERLNRHGIFDPIRVQHLVNNLYQNESDYNQVNKVLVLIIFQEWFEMYL